MHEPQERKSKAEFLRNRLEKEISECDLIIIHSTAVLKIAENKKEVAERELQRWQ